MSQTTQASPRSVFSKNRRFMSLTHRYISKDHNMANLCTASPGPKYAPKHSHLDLTTRFAPEFSFGGRNNADRSAFIHGAVGADGVSGSGTQRERAKPEIFGTSMRAQTRPSPRFCILIPSLSLSCCSSLLPAFLAHVHRPPRHQ